MKIWKSSQGTLPRLSAALLDVLPDQFRTLVEHFFGRFFDRDSLSPDADEHANVVQMIAMLAVPGAIISLFLLVDHPLVRSEVTRLWLRAGDRYVFVCYAMVVMGFVMTFKWDSLFPDRRDYLILTPLPISLREFFIAKVVALGGFLLLFIVAINFFSCVIVPYAYLVRDNRWDVLLPGFFAHATAVFGASIFTALFFAALQGVLISLMTPGAFRRISPWIQMISMTFLVTILLITPGISGNIRMLLESHSRVLDYIPLFWFLGIYEVLNPDGTPIPESYIWARSAVDAMFWVSAVFVLTYLIGYWRHSKKILEGIESYVFAPAWHQRAIAWLLNLCVLRHPFQRASFYFIGKIFTRSSKHRLFIAMYSGIGLAVTISSLFVIRRDADFLIAISRKGLVEAPLILSFFAVSGLRATFNIPYELNANWMFQIVNRYDAAEYLKAARRWVVMRGIIPPYALLSVLEFALLDPVQAAFQLAFGFVIAVLLVELFFLNFNKVPFTCSYLPAKSHLAFLGGAYLYGFTIYTFTMGNLEAWVAARPQRMVAFFLFVAAILTGISIYRHHTQDRTLEIVYEDDADPLIRQLNLS
jgi:hypothetical protein